MNELQLSYPEDVVVREVITELLHCGILTPKDYVKFMRFTTQMSVFNVLWNVWLLEKLNTYLEKMEKEEKQ